MPSIIDADLRWVREGDRLGLAVSREFPRDQELDPDSVLGVTEVLAAGERRNVTQAFEALVDGLQALAGDQDIDVDGQAAEAVCVQRHAARHGIRDAQLFQSARDLSQRLEDLAHHARK